MARQERPVDPHLGPLQSFAHDLRALRNQAGSPTYRALAKTAGYSATTLSQAASGVHKPSLEVVLAYVGACQGDPVVWRQRWQELDWVLRHGAPAAAPSGSADAAARTRTFKEFGRPHPEPHAGPGAPIAATPRRPWWRSPRWAVALAVVAAAGTVVVGTLGLATRSTGPRCPSRPDRAAFTGTSYLRTTNVRRGASLDEPVIGTVSAGCTLGFTSYCLGQKVYDATARTPDIRWFQMADGGLVASAVIHGNPPASLGPTLCRGARPAPAAIALTVISDSRKPGSLVLRAEGTNLEIVGFAAFYAPNPAADARQWHQITLSGTPAPTFDAVWQPGRLLTQRDPVLVAAVACLGGNGATSVIDLKAAHPDNVQQTGVPALTGPEIDGATRTACRYPTAG